jgi:hypothetical protein
VDELVGSGGFAWVYRGYDPELDIPVALKVLKPQFAGDEAFEQRFRREASTAARLRHPNIIKIYTVGREGDAVFFAMDYLPNGLADRLEVTNVLPEEFVIRVGMDVASALGFAHREGVIHRDIKVDNILFDSHGNAVVADFGIARAVSGYTGQTGTNMVVGTPQYFAPEQARAKPLDGRADIYSLGVTMFRASTGNLPFAGDDWYEIARQHVEDPPPAPRDINPALSEGFSRVILHCMEKIPDDRPATGEALCTELATLLPSTLQHSAYLARFTGSDNPTLVVRTPQGSEPVRTPATPTAATAITGAAAVAGRRRSALWMAGAVGLAMLFVAAAWLRDRAGAGAATPTAADTTVRPVIDPIDSAIAAAQDSTAAGSTRPPLDSAARADSLRRDSIARAAARFARVVITAPPGARILVDGKEVGTERWQSDSVRPGKHDIAASYAAMEGCDVAEDRRAVTLRGGRQLQTIALEPKSCGRLVIVGERDARWELTPKAGGPARSGTVPDTVLVPEGDYALVARKPYCTEFTHPNVSVTRATPGQVRFTMICQPPRP